MSTFAQFFPSSGPSGSFGTFSGSFSGSFQGDGSKLTNVSTASFAHTASYLEGFIESASYALTASYALNAGSGGLTSGSIVTGSTIIDSILTSSTVVDTVITSSTIVDTTITSSTVLDTTISSSTIIDTTITGSTVLDTTITGSTIVDTIITSSTVLDTTITGSTVLDTTITGSTVLDTTITGSTVLDTTITGSTVLDTTITGSTVLDTTITGSTIVDSVISSSTLVEVIGSGSFSGSFVGDGSGLTNIETASYAHTASYAISSSHEIIHEVSSSFAETSSYALTASYALNGGGGGAIINPTDNVVPLRSDSTTFVDSIIQQPSTIGSTAFSVLAVSPFVPTTEAGTVSSPGVLVDSTLSPYIQNGDVLFVTTQGIPTAPNLALPGGGFIEPGQSATLRLVNAAGTIPAGDYEGRYFDYTRIDFNSATPTNGTMAWRPENQSLDWSGEIDNSVTLAFFAGGGLGNTIRITGSLDVTSNITASSIEAAFGFTGSLLGTASYALTASYLDGFIESASYAATASYLDGFIESASFATTASHALTASYLDGFIESASYAESSSNAESSSYALTASYALNGGGGGGTINPTNNFIPIRSGSDTFIDSPISVITGSSGLFPTSIATTGTFSVPPSSTFNFQNLSATALYTNTDFVTPGFVLNSKVRIHDTVNTVNVLITNFNITNPAPGIQVEPIPGVDYSSAPVLSNSNGPIHFIQLEELNQPGLTYLSGSTFGDSISGSFTGSYLGNLQGTASYALTASYLEGFVESASFAATASHALTASYLDGFIESASYAEYAATSSIKYDSGSGVITGLDEIKINDFDDNVGVTFQNSKLTLTFGSPATPSISSFFNSGFLTDRFNQVLDSYSTIGNWDNGGYTFVEASILQGSTVLSTTTTPGSTNLTLPQSTAGSQSYTLIYTGSSPLDGSEYKLSSTATSNLSKSNPGLPSISDTVTIQLGDTNNQFEQGAVGSIAFSTNYGASNGWDQVSITNTPSSSPISVTGGGSTGITIQSVAEYQSPTGENSPQLSTSRTATRTFSKIRSVRYGASTAASFTQTELEDLGSWDTTLGGTIGTIDKGNTNPSGDTLTITWSGDKYQYIIYDGNRSDLTGIATSGFGVIGQFTKSTVGDYTVYRTNVLQAGGSGASITYNLT